MKSRLNLEFVTSRLKITFIHRLCRKALQYSWKRWEFQEKNLWGVTRLTMLARPPYLPDSMTHQLAPRSLVTCRCTPGEFSLPNVSDDWLDLIYELLRKREIKLAMDIFVLCVPKDSQTKKIARHQYQAILTVLTMTMFPSPGERVLCKSLGRGVPLEHWNPHPILDHD